MTPDEICGFVIGDICGTPYNPYHKWQVVFPPVTKPPIQLLNVEVIFLFFKDLSQILRIVISHFNQFN